ncbi:MAG: acetate--CoA ligase family protein [Rubrivivax sp.]|nr:acetate--CoA ligase family protein [Rubrivivax sp.]
MRGVIQADPIAIVDRPRVLVGYVQGLRQPSLVYALRLAEVDEVRSLALAEALAPELTPCADQRVPSSHVAHLDRMLGWIDALLEKAGLPVLENPRVRRASPWHPGVHIVLHPSLMPMVCLRAVELVVRLSNQALHADPGQAAQGAEQMREQVRALIKQLARFTPRGFNNFHFLKAAVELDVPFSCVTPTVFQFGWGARSRWLSSSFTDHTPHISTILARDKSAAAEVLRAAGLPVPSHAIANDAGHAVEVAQRLGYPVVVKPADLDGGVGVRADLRNAASVRGAFESAQAHSKRVLVEKHVTGRDYRIHVVNDEVQGVLERVPGGVTGNGVQSVQSLLDRQNLERRAATDDRRFLKEMNYDSEASDQLEEQGLSVDAVPAAGRFVRLRAAANVASGGIPVPVAAQAVHPDNLLLARRAAAALRLDVAGIDLLIADIGQSWMEIGAVICEVNAQPQMFTTLHKPMLRRLLGEGNGRIPAVVVLGGPSGQEAGASIHLGLTATGLVAGLVRGDSVWAGARCISRRSPGLHAAGTMLLRDPTIEALVLCAADDGVLHSGWPIDRCDVLVLAGPQIRTTAEPASRALAAMTASGLSLNPTRVVVDAQTADACARAGSRLPSDARLCVLGAAHDGAAAPLPALVQAVMLALHVPSSST